VCRNDFEDPELGFSDRAHSESAPLSHRSPYDHKTSQKAVALQMKDRPNRLADHHHPQHALLSSLGLQCNSPTASNLLDFLSEFQSWNLFCMIACLYSRDADWHSCQHKASSSSATSVVTASMLAGAAKTAFLQGRPVQMVPLHLPPGLA